MKEKIYDRTYEIKKNINISNENIKKIPILAQNEVFSQKKILK